MTQTLSGYYKELWGWDVVSNNKEFIAYSFPDNTEIAWINELFIPEEERNGVTSLRDMAKRVEKLAKEKNKSGVAANIILVNSSGGVHSNPTRIVKIMIYWGFKIVNCDKNVITLFKEFEKEDNSSPSVQDEEE